ncbi:MAG: hypothetical protein RI897_3827 [Verrucomicrobiota bacterium]
MTCGHALAFSGGFCLGWGGVGDFIYGYDSGKTSCWC